MYILDTGVFAGHSDFENRVIKSVDFTGEGIGDNNGHGMFHSQSFKGQSLI